MSIRVFYLFVLILFSSTNLSGVEPAHSDTMALKFCEESPDSHVLFLYPSAIGYENEVEEILKTYAEIVHKKYVSFTEKGGLNFLLTAYENDGFTLNNKSLHRKACLCFPKKVLKNNPARVYLLQCESLELMRQCKTEIRALFNIAKHSVHSTDTHEEAIILARALFNDNSVQCLNHRHIISFPLFDECFKSYRNWLKYNVDKSKWFCADAEAVMAVYGLRDSDDFGYLCSQEGIPDFGIPGITNHGSQAGCYPCSLEDILSEPENHFFYKGVKFCSLSVAKKMKEQRNVARDANDIQLIANLPNKSWE